MSAVHHLRSCAAGRGRRRRPEQDRSSLPFWISAGGTDVPPSHRAAAHGHGSHFRFKMVRKQILPAWLLWSPPSCSLFCVFVGATCPCQTEHCWEWQQLPGSCSCTRYLTIRWEMWHHRNLRLWQSGPCTTKQVQIPRVSFCYPGSLTSELAVTQSWLLAC